MNKVTPSNGSVAAFDFRNAVFAASSYYSGSNNRHYQGSLESIRMASSFSFFMKKRGKGKGGIALNGVQNRILSVKNAQSARTSEQLKVQ